jgi:hypothetical protein
MPNSFTSNEWASLGKGDAYSFIRNGHFVQGLYNLFGPGLLMPLLFLRRNNLACYYRTRKMKFGIPDIWRWPRLRT